MRIRHVALLALATAANAAILLTGHAAAQSTDTPCAPAPTEQPTTPPTPQPEPTPEPPAAPPAPTTLRLSELLADPVGKDTDGEFIEIRNVGTVAIATAGWRLADAKSHSTALPAGTITPDGYVAYSFTQTGLALTNSGGTIMLIAPNGETVDSITYPAAKEGVAYARHADSVWKDAKEPTPGAQNSFATAIPEPEPPTTPDPQPTPEPTVPAEPSPLPPAQPTPTLAEPIVSEVLPDPAGSDDAEWIELFNPNDAPFPLEGWKLDDAPGGSTPHAFPAGTTLPARMATVIARSASGLALNNDGDSVRLLRPDGTTASELAMDRAKENLSFNRLADGDTAWMSPSPGQHPPAPAIAGEVAGAAITDAEDVDAGSTASVAMTIAEAREAEPGQTVTTAGVVALAPGRITTTTTVLVDEHGAGILVRSSGFSSTPPAVGDVLEVTGATSWHAYGPMVIATKDDVVARGKGEVPIIEEGLDPPEAPAVAASTGRITKLAAMSVGILADDGGEITVALARPSDKTGLRKGDRVTVAGVLVAKGDPPTLYAKPGGIAAAEPPAVVPSPAAQSTMNTASGRRIPWVAVAGGGGAIALAGAWHMYRRRHAVIPDEATTPLLLAEIDEVPAVPRHIRLERSV